MDTIERDTLTALAEHTGWPAISIYLPTHRAGSDKEQDRIRFKNLMRSACDKLVADGMRAPHAEAFCEPVSTTLTNGEFWRDTSEGMVVFVNAMGSWVVKLDVAVPETIVVGDRFYLRPLLAAHRGERRFFALALDKNGCRLYRGDAASLEQIDLGDVPASLAEELKYDQREESLQLTTFAGPQAAAGAGRAQGMFHGHGGEKDVDKIGLERYLRKIEGAVAKSIACEHSAPLLLMGVDYIIATYRALNTCPSVVEEQVTGATDELTPYLVHTKAMEALEPVFSAAEKSQLDELRERMGSPLAMTDPLEIVAAAAAGRVKTLFFDDGLGPFGTFDRESFSVEAVCADEPRMLRVSGDADTTEAECGWDLVDLAAAETTLHGGDVRAFSGEDAPIKGVAAVLRY